MIGTFCGGFVFDTITLQDVEPIRKCCLSGIILQVNEIKTRIDRITDADKDKDKDKE